MSFNLDRAFGIHEQALRVRARRTEVLASNLANADTPGYRARDVDFRSVLQDQGVTVPAATVRVTHVRHMPGATTGDLGLTQYRVPNQPSLDGNTVEPEVEQAAFLDNALRYQASLQFLSRRIRGLQTALRGE